MVNQTGSLAPTLEERRPRLVVLHALPREPMLHAPMMPAHSVMGRGDGRMKGTPRGETERKKELKN